jgi:hypothetical protein
LILGLEHLILEVLRPPEHTLKQTLTQATLKKPRINLFRPLRTFEKVDSEASQRPLKDPDLNKGKNKYSLSSLTLARGFKQTDSVTYMQSPRRQKPQP